MSAPTNQSANNNNARIRIPFRTAVTMVFNYASAKVLDQAKSVAFIIIYLVAFQIFVLNTTPTNALQVAGGIAMVIFGLAFFLEGLYLGLMPLGERVGVKLPQKSHIVVIIIFGLLLGLGSTFAEPAIASLRMAGAGVTPWQAPLLYRMLETNPGALVTAVAAGVGVAVETGMLRLYYGLSIKVLLFILAPITTAATAYFAFDETLSVVLGLAWDTGAVTTGAVTVPLVLALGIGVARTVNKRNTATAGFGIVSLASLFPVMGVMILALTLLPDTPSPTSETDFFASSNRKAAIALVGKEGMLPSLAFQRGSEEGRKALFEDEKSYIAALNSLADRTSRRKLLGNLRLYDWLLERASQSEYKHVVSMLPHDHVFNASSNTSFDEVLREEATLGLRAVIPLVMLLLITLVLLLRDRPRYADEVTIGILFALAGMTMLTSGIRLGLAPLGDQAGRPLPRLFRSEAHEKGRIIIDNFDLNQVFTAYDHAGIAHKYFYVDSGGGTPRAVKFKAHKYDNQQGVYEHVLEEPPLFSPKLTLIGIALVLIFAFGLGYGSTIAEPALNALGHTVEELSVGIIKSSGVVNSVSIGVGSGLVLGVARILYDIPIAWLLIPAYLLLLPLTYFSDEDFAGIAWDSGGVTTGSITVPLVLSMGLGIGSATNVSDGFGVLAMASVMPIISVLIYGLSLRAGQQQLLDSPDKGGEL